MFCVWRPNPVARQTMTPASRSQPMASSAPGTARMMPSAISSSQLRSKKVFAAAALDRSSNRWLNTASFDIPEVSLAYRSMRSNCTDPSATPWSVRVRVMARSSRPPSNTVVPTIASTASRMPWAAPGSVGSSTEAACRSDVSAVSGVMAQSPFAEKRTPTRPRLVVPQCKRSRTPG
ncbi:hypothetical protein D9M72_433830 [compost metagenome]